tara:strand:+ start:731 stop:997 length:267 start_codon:yes stop_codon:yes gene_type:complete
MRYAGITDKGWLSVEKDKAAAAEQNRLDRLADIDAFEMEARVEDVERDLTAWLLANPKVGSLQQGKGRLKFYTTKPFVDGYEKVSAFQ